MKAAVVITTIHDPVLLEGYYDNLAKYGHLDSTKVFVIPDCKTPPACYSRCSDLSKRGLSIECPDLASQDLFLARIGLPSNFIPRNSDNRRNVGYLLALEWGCDFLISLDDDNFCIEGSDYLAGHLDTSTLSRTTSGGWFDPCCGLTGDGVFARGFPYFARSAYHPAITPCASTSAIVNEGLWITNPDVDAISLLSGGHFDSPPEHNYVLGSSTWAPINSQNTSVRRACIPAYYFLQSPRFGDIYQGYFLLACCKHLGYTARFGTPLVDHRRNSHDYLRDAELELPDIRRLEELLPRLIEAKLQGSTFSEAYLVLSEWLDMPSYASAMREWLSACRTIGV